jgi:hypothetical protein
MIFFGEPAGDEADHAGVPAAAAEDEGRHAASLAQVARLAVGRTMHAALQGLPLLVEAVDKLGELARTLGQIGDEQLQSKRGLTKAAGGVEPRGNRISNVLACNFRLLVQTSDLLQRQNARRWIMSEAVEAMAHEDAVFVHKRYHVGHRSDCGQAHGPHQEGAHRLANPFGLARLLAQRPGELQCDARPA